MIDQYDQNISPYTYDPYLIKRDNLNFAKEQKMNANTTYAVNGQPAKLNNDGTITPIQAALAGKEMIKDLPLITLDEIYMPGLTGDQQRGIFEVVNLKFKQRVAELKVQLPKMPAIYVYEYTDGQVGFFSNELKQDIQKNMRLSAKIDQYIVTDIPQPEPTLDKSKLLADFKSKIDELKVIADKLTVPTIENGVSL